VEACLAEIAHGLSDVRHKPGQKEKNFFLFSFSSEAGLKE